MKYELHKGKACDLSCSLLKPKCLEQGLAYSRCSINNCLLNKHIVSRGQITQELVVASQ